MSIFAFLFVAIPIINGSSSPIINANGRGNNGASTGGNTRNNTVGNCELASKKLKEYCAQEVKAGSCEKHPKNMCEVCGGFCYRKNCYKKRRKLKQESIRLYDISTIEKCHEKCALLKKDTPDGNRVLGIDDGECSNFAFYEIEKKKQKKTLCVLSLKAPSTKLKRDFKRKSKSGRRISKKWIAGSMKFCTSLKEKIEAFENAVENKCVCENGSGASGVDCPNDGEEKCARCDKGYQPNDQNTKCVEEKEQTTGEEQGDEEEQTTEGAQTDEEEQTTEGAQTDEEEQI